VARRRPPETALAFADLHIIVAGLAAAHQAVLVEFPLLIAVYTLIVPIVTCCTNQYNASSPNFRRGAGSRWSEGFDARNIRFDEDSLHALATLPKVITAPEKARAMFEQRADVIISIGMGRKQGLFWNMYDRDALQSLSFSFSVGENQRDCQGWTAEFEKVRATQSG